jgi:hypothetical protein
VNASCFFVPTDCWFVAFEHTVSATEQRESIRFGVLLHESPSEALRMIEDCMGMAKMRRAQVYERRERYRDGRVSVNDDPSCGRPSTSINEDI